MVVKKTKQSTYDRIVEASLKLFNEEGERQISTNHISAYLGISPGNLYYHFRNKDEIIMQLFKRYRHDLLTFLESSETPLEAVQVRAFVEKAFDIMWDYRFFFNDVTTLLSRSSELQGEHEKFTLDHVSPLIMRYLTQVGEAGVIDMDQTDREVFTMNFWIVTKYWFVFDSSIHNNELDKASKRRGLKQTLGMLRPYLTSAYRPAYDDMLSKL